MMRARFVYGCLYFSVCKAMELSMLLISSIYQGILLLHRKKKILGTRGLCLLQGPAHAISLLFQSVAPSFPLGLDMPICRPSKSVLLFSIQQSA